MVLVYLDELKVVRLTDAAEAELFSERERNSVLKLYGSGPLTSPKTFQLH